MSTLNELSRMNKRLNTNAQQNIDRMRLELIDVIERRAWQLSDKAMLKVLLSKMSLLESEGSRVLREMRFKILESLNFKVMRTRLSDVKQAHAETFRWAVQDLPRSDTHQEPGFLDWLEDPNGDIYWIAGKAGSGKSTLMKYLHDHTRVQKSLRVWAATKNTPLIVASHFFWNAGNNILQMSQVGLFRSLLYQVLRQHPSLIPDVCSSKWDPSGKYCGTLESWTLQELYEAFKRLSEQDEISICYFIDGLDEYDGTHSDIIDLLKDSAISKNIKLCVSSRPWNVFEDAFGRKRKLMLQDYTREDIRRYVEDQLEEDHRFRKFAVQDSKILIQEIISKAQGVFLWVYLVVRSLLRGLTDDNEISDMRRRVDSLPADLAEYFKHMIIGVEDIYLQQTARIFQICVEAIRPPTVLTFSYLSAEEANPNYAISAEIRGLTKQEVTTLHTRMKKYINSRCTDLLEISVARTDYSFSFLESKVNFVHRTVRDFLKSQDIQEMLRKHTAAGFDARRYLCRALLAQVKALPLGVSVRPTRGHFENMLSMADEIMFYVHSIEKFEGKSEISILDELDRVNTIHARNLGGIHWTNARVPVKELLAENGASTFLALAIQAGLEIYVAHKLDAEPSLLRGKKGRPLLDYALRNDLDNELQLQRQEVNIDAGIARLLLDRGADPNQKVRFYDNRTVWELFLVSCYRNREKLELGPWQAEAYQVSSMLICSGANPSINCNVNDYVVDGTKWRQFKTCQYIEIHSISSILAASFDQDQYSRLETLLTSKRQWAIWKWLGWS
jgi:Arc/MetJ family transcription regulator